MKLGWHLAKSEPELQWHLFAGHNIAYRTGVHDCIVVKCYHGYHGKHRCTLVIPSYSGVYHFTPNPKKTMIFFIWCAMLFLTWDALTIMNQAQNEYQHALANISRSRYVAIPTQPVRGLQIRLIVHNQGHPLPLPQVTSGSAQQCGHAFADRQTHIHQTRVTTIHFASSTVRLTRNVIIIFSASQARYSVVHCLQNIGRPS